MRQDVPVLAILFGVRARACYIDVTKELLHVVVGWWFNETIPRDEVVRVKPVTHAWASGIGGGRISFFALTDGVVEIDLRHARRIRFGFLFPRVRRIAVALNDPDGFLSETG